MIRAMTNDRTLPILLLGALVASSCASPRESLRGSLTALCQQQCWSHPASGELPSDCLKKCEGGPQAAPRPQANP
jgi:hypothetical protein